ncbi:hypothetical protein FA13DRAFT_846526 [Coprinellus micaceus]|uniref:Uncharacterized protein n=1 Tax=Coprinellus micaceus TaxID=71717 RepID=A0A4Y7S2H9_COPMI|nr:hypothetical protein FA13DRAFT_846526 [Coprinellus micaceus]
MLGAQAFLRPSRRAKAKAKASRSRGRSRQQARTSQMLYGLNTSIRSSRSEISSFPTATLLIVIVSYAAGRSRLSKYDAPRQSTVPC